MRLLILSLGLIASAVIAWRALAETPLLPDSQKPMTIPSAATPIEAPMTPLPDSADRVAFARARHGASIAKKCADAGLTYPPRGIFLRAFKLEGELEAWGCGKDGKMKLIATYSLTARSGTFGPKRKQGDRQIPEGCYQVVIFNPKSMFHLSLGLNYPNDADRVHADREQPGDDIYIHGNEVSIGCLALGDEMIEEVYLLALDAHAKFKADAPVHIFPTRMEGAAWTEFRGQNPTHAEFWAELEPIYAAFEATRRVPKVKVNAAGKYELER